jgi:uncharacterized protein (DUF2141 family)
MNTPLINYDKISLHFKERDELRIFATLVIISIFGLSATLKVDVNGIRSSRGDIYVGIFNNSKNFLTPRGIYRWIKIKAKRGNVSCQFRHLPRGQYAVALFHDENANEKFDLTTMGFPKEGWALSGKVSGLGMPEFKDCSFFVNPKKRYRIKLRLQY